MDIAIPHDVLAEAPDDESKVRKLGYIARGAAVFRAETIIIYTYGEGVDWEEVELMKLLLEYASTPPHLRRRLFKLDRRLKLAGLLPPLRIPSHMPPREPSAGDVVDGVVERWDGYYSLVYIGGGKYAKIPKPYPIGSRLIVRIEAETSRPDTYRAVVVKRPPDYWGYRVEVKPFKQLAEGYDTAIYTGREGRSVCEGLPRPVGRTLVVFGGPKAGVDEIARIEGIELKGLFLNFIPRQGTEAVRTEEAIFAVLALLNYANICSVGKPTKAEK